MTATVTRPTAARPAGVSGSEPTSGRLRVRRQPKWIAAGVLAMCLGGLGAAVLWGEASGSADVLVLTRAVSRGEIVAASDFRVAQVGQLDGASSVRAADLPTLAGQQALVDLAEGALLPAGSVGRAALDPGGVQLGLRLVPGRVPLGDLPAGTAVLLVPLEDPRTNPGAETELPRPVRASVLTPPRTGPDGVAQLLDVRVDTAQAPVVAMLAATDRIALVKEGR
ncbi:SAF domain-containing protein [Granulicoccus sp. GXG6511]|uniref:SAF domain-containing protein n=1 Tax=Granulicoccus sp. GXG6511 TaxID=3381351 RepID=UPI003D7DB3C0